MKSGFLCISFRGVFSALLLSISLNFIATSARAQASADDSARLLYNMSVAGWWQSAQISGAHGSHTNILGPAMRPQVDGFFQRALGTIQQETRGLIYLFGGADSVFPNLAFPNAERILMVGLEPVGRMPDTAQLSQGQIQQQANSIRGVFEYLFTRSYFVTTQMSSGLAQVGTSTAIAVGLVGLGARIDSLEYISLNGAGEIVGSAQGRIPGMRMRFTKANGQRSEIIYFSLNLSSEFLATRPEFAAYVNRNSFETAYYKAASYVPQWGSMGAINNLVLSRVRHVVQNDDGVPFHAFLANAQSWSIRLYGLYTRPHSQFGASVQNDLLAAYNSLLCGGDDQVWQRLWGACRQDNPNRFGFHSLELGHQNGRQREYYLPFRYGYSATTGPSGVLSWADMIAFGNLIVASKVAR